MHSYIHISANQVPTKSPPPLDYLNITLSGVGQKAFDDTIKPIRMDVLRRLPSSIDFQAYPNLHGQLGVLEVKPAQSVYEAVDKPYNFVSTFSQHHLAFVLTPHTSIRPIPVYFSRETHSEPQRRAFATTMNFMQFKPETEAYQVIHLATSLAHLGFEVVHDPEHQAINVEAWNAFYGPDDVQIDSHSSSMNKTVYMHRIFDRIDDDSNMEVVNTFCPNYLESYKLYEKEIEDLEEDSPSPSDTDSDDELPAVLRSLIIPPSEGLEVRAAAPSASPTTTEPETKTGN